MSHGWNLIALAVLIGTFTLAGGVQAQPPGSPGRPGPDHRPHAGGNVVARVNVNVETEVDVAQGSMEANSDSDEDESQAEDERENTSDLADLLETLLKQAGPGSVIADINVNVETSIKVRVQGGKPTAPKPPAVKPSPTEKETATADEEKTRTPAPDAPRKKRRKKRAQAPSETSIEPTQAAEPTGVALNRLRIGDTLELGVTGALGSEQQANQIAQRINVGKNQTLLGMAFVGMMLPEEAESLKVVQKAISSVQANATGNELSVSVAIPKETPGAVKTLVQAALEKK